MIRLILLAALLPLPALAHPDHAQALGFAAGALHPLGGLDHLAAMLAVGLWAGLTGGRARWVLPAGFVVGMAAGLALGAAGVALPMVEPGILASVLALAACVALVARPTRPLALALAAALVAGFGLLHGHAHGAEASGAALLPFAAGVLLVTAALHAVGVAAATPAAPRLRLALRASAGTAGALAAPLVM
jgi:urease accessory protein